MKKIDLGQTVSILANLGVIAGIAFLAAELRQNNALMAAEARSNRVVIMTQTWDMLAQDPILVPLLLKDRNGERLSGEDEFRLSAFWMRVLLQTQWSYLELPESTEWTAGHRRNFESYRSLRQTWQGGGEAARAAGRDTLDPRFVRFYEDNVINP